MAAHEYFHSPHVDNYRFSDSDLCPGPKKSITLSQLRDLAQSHLDEIDLDKAQEESDEARKKREIEWCNEHRQAKKEYSNRKQKSEGKKTAKKRDIGEGTAEDKGKHPTSVYEGKRPRLRSSQDVISRLNWDTLHFRTSGFVVGYLDRFDGIIQISLDEWLARDKREVTSEDFVPWGRLWWIERAGEKEQTEVVWSRKERIDKIYGSGMAQEMIMEERAKEIQPS